MVSIIKKQLLKHLSRFTKNLSVDKINLSTFKGEGELTNLELDETVLTDLLELPSWLRLTHAWCNKVSFRIQWTKLRSVPIFLTLDEVHIEVETCEDLRNLSSPQGMSSYAGPTKYSFIQKVIDGITVSVNTVSVTFKSPAFIASVQMNRIIVESKSATWQRCDLRSTRLKDPDRGQLLIFKELEWQTVRIEAQSTKDKNLTPLRLLTNQARCRITIKKRISDCFVMGSKLVLILDDLLWVLTDSQLKAALHFIDSLGGLIEKATILERKTKAARKLEVLPEYQAQISQQTRTKNQFNTVISKIFSRYDVVETSYHFLCQRIDLHLCDDPGNGRSSHPDLKDGGALQISLVSFQVDYYPYHLAMAGRKHWAKYRESATPHSQWLQQSLSSFRSQFMDLIDSGRTQHSPLTRSQGNVTVSNTKGSGENLEKGNQAPNANATSHEQKKSQHPSGNPVKNYILEQLAKLMTTCIIIRIDDFTLYKVTTTSRNPIPKEFITAQTRKKHATGERDRFCLPEDVTILHAEFTYYYYPGDITFPLPPPKFYVQLNPIQVNFDVCSCLWFNSFALNLHHSLMNKDTQTIHTSSNFMYFDVKIEAILPRIVFESQQDYPNQKDRPKSLHIQTSRASITNVRSTERSSRADLAQCLNAFQMGQMFFSTEFPNKSSDFHVVTDKFLSHCAATDNIRHPPPNFSSNSVNELIRQLHRELLWTEAKDVWCCNLEPVWGDFFGARAVGQNRPVPFLDAFPLTFWCYISMNSSDSEKSSTADIHGLAYISNLVSVQINHYQYLFLLRLSEILSEMATYLTIDSNKILKVDSDSSLIIGALIPQVEVTFVMPSHTPGKENSGGDLESVMPDSSSIADDIASSSTPWQNNAEQVDFSCRKMIISTGVLTPQSEVSSMLSMDFMHPVNTTQTVTFKQNGGNKNDQQTLANTSIEKQFMGVEERALPTVRYASESTHKHSKGDSSSNTPFIPNNFNAGFSSMKKGFSNFITSIDSALKASPEDGSSDTVSIRSDVSSDSENYVLIDLQDQEKLDAMFAFDNANRITAVEEASEVVEETPDTQSEKSMDSVCKRKDIVSMATFKLSKVEFIQQSCGYSSSIKVQVSNIGNDECSSIPWDEFQTKFSARSRGWIELPSDSNCRSCVKLRLDHDLKCKSDSYKLSQASQNIINNKVQSSQNQSNVTEQEVDACVINVHNKQSVLDLFEDKLDVKVTNVTMALSMSSITGLTDLIEDEIIPKPIPMQIYLESISLRLNEDRPPNNITSPGPIPIDLNISKLRIVRDTNGVFHVEPVVSVLSTSNSLATVSNSGDQTAQNVDREIELNILRHSSKQLKSDNEELRRRLDTLEKLSEENAKLMRVKEESDTIKSYLNAAQEDIQILLREKKALQETIMELQNQVIGSGGTRGSWSTKR
ncbi:bridge-like lipid transfer protein family member 3B isoform X2 [Hylaeus volcanicus]|uniref:bridge-like lipid transfer protein family member 3B isoform X2 n=1 Tax=Hylaeus volcanicus TaxID=313075 RepID=UPI0023B7846E|nr:bridge-like lipid transfer protein family member 3B isoform X2 [Hylaeus volcanicus]